MKCYRMDTVSPKRCRELFFPKGGAHYTDLPFRVPSSHAAPTGLLSGLRPTGLTAAWQIRTFFLPLLEKRIIRNALTNLLDTHDIIYSYCILSPILCQLSRSFSCFDDGEQCLGALWFVGAFQNCYNQSVFCPEV